MTMLTGDNDSWAKREDVRQMGRDILEHMDRRFKEKKETDSDKHDEYLGRFDTLITKSDRLTDRVTTLEALTRALQDEFQAIRKRWHDFRDSVQTKLADGGFGTGENRKLTTRDFTIAFSGVSLGLSMFYALAKILKWIP
jgi:hypothetical protein